MLSFWAIVLGAFGGVSPQARLLGDSLDAQLARVAPGFRYESDRKRLEEAVRVCSWKGWTAQWLGEGIPGGLETVAWTGVDSLGRPVRFLVQVPVKRWQRVVTARKRLERGKILVPEDVELVEKEASAWRVEPVPVDSVAGLELRAAMGPGQVLFRHLVDEPPLFREGDRVTVRVRAGAATVAASAEALQDGRRGRKAKVRLDTGRETQGVVQADGVVLLELTPGVRARE